MPSMIQKDMKQLMQDVEVVQESLEILNGNYAARGSDIREANLLPLLKNVTHLESDLSMTISDCVSLGRRYWKDHNLPAIGTLHQSFVDLNSLFSMLKRIKENSRGRAVHPSEFQELIIDWYKFKKSLLKAMEFIKRPQIRRKHYPWPAEAKGKKTPE